MFLEQHLCSLFVYLLVLYQLGKYIGLCFWFPSFCPVVDMYIYDSEMDKSWETRSRGQYTYPVGIKPGDKQKGSISVVPKTFRNLDLKKNIRLALNDTESGFITAVNDAIFIS